MNAALRWPVRISVRVLRRVECPRVVPFRASICCNKACGFKLCCAVRLCTSVAELHCGPDFLVSSSTSDLSASTGSLKHRLGGGRLSCSVSGMKAILLSFWEPTQRSRGNGWAIQVEEKKVGNSSETQRRANRGFKIQMPPIRNSRLTELFAFSMIKFHGFAVPNLAAPSSSPSSSPPSSRDECVGGGAGITA